ncbi:hypothetical protein ABIE33_004896 [Ensifer sp. 4252]
MTSRIADDPPFADKLLEEPRFEGAGKSDALACRQAIEDRIFDGIAADDKDRLTFDVRALQRRSAETRHALRGCDLATESWASKGIDVRLMLPVARIDQRRRYANVSAARVLPYRLEEIIHFCPKVIRVEPPIYLPIGEHERLGSAMAGQHPIRPLVLQVDACRDEKDIGWQIREAERLGAASKLILVQFVAPVSEALAMPNRYRSAIALATCPCVQNGLRNVLQKIGLGFLTS